MGDTTHMENYEMFLRNLRAIRKKMGYKQEVFANVIGIKRSDYTKRELGQTDFSVRELLKLNEAIRIPWYDLLGFGAFETDRVTISIMDLIATLTDERKKLLLNVARSFRGEQVAEDSQGDNSNELQGNSVSGPGVLKSLPPTSQGDEAYSPENRPSLPKSTKR